MAKYTKNIIRRKKQRPAECYYCKQKLEPDYKDPESVKHFVTERGKITKRMENGLCQYHQHELTKAVKRARYIAILPFIVRPV